MSIPNDIISKNPCLNDWAILIGYRGSIAHGMYVPKNDPNSIDDKDIMGVCVPPIDYYFGLNQFGPRGTKEIMQGEWDIVVYEARKFIDLLMKGNPNVLSLIWLDAGMYLKVTSAGQMLIDNRNLFVGRHVYKSFVGYAQRQLHRMTHTACEGYMGAKRKALVEKFGYDCKNAAHLIRLLRMAIEFLKDGEMNVMRYDSQMLLEIKRGEWELQRVTEEADRLFKLADEVYVASTLPKEPDRDKVNALCCAVVKEHFRTNQ
jgi:uncharacterized protein